MSKENQEIEKQGSNPQSLYNPLDRIGIVQQELVKSVRSQQQSKDDSEKEKAVEEDNLKTMESSEKPPEQEVKTDNRDVKEEERSSKESKEKNPEVNPEIEILQKRFSDSQRLVTKTNQAISEAKKKIAEMVESGDLSEEDSQNLLNALKMEGVSFSETKALEKGEKTPLDAVSDVLTQDVIQQYLDFSEDDQYHKKIFAFQAFYDELTGDEQKAIVSEILDEKTPVKILKKILSLGDDNLKSEYGEIIAMGSPKKYAIAQKEKIKKLEAEIERYKKKLEQYNDFDKPTAPVTQKKPSPYSSPSERYNPVAMMEAKKRELSKLVANR